MKGFIMKKILISLLLTLVFLKMNADEELIKYINSSDDMPKRIKEIMLKEFKEKKQIIIDANKLVSAKLEEDSLGKFSAYHAYLYILTYRYKDNIQELESLLEWMPPDAIFKVGLTLHTFGEKYVKDVKYYNFYKIVLENYLKEFLVNKTYQLNGSRIMDDNIVIYSLPRSLDKSKFLKYITTQYEVIDKNSKLAKATLISNMYLVDPKKSKTVLHDFYCKEFHKVELFKKVFDSNKKTYFEKEELNELIDHKIAFYEKRIAELKKIKKNADTSPVDGKK